MKWLLDARAAVIAGLVAALTASLLAIAPAAAQTSVSANWTQLPIQGPSARSGVSLSYDSARGQTVLFGGAGYLADTWQFDGRAWTQMQVNGPPGRELGPMVFDSARRVSVLFGGIGLPGYFQDTWEWDGVAWTRRFTAHTPPSRDWSAMAYDSRRHVVVLFGGTGGTGLLNDTWEYDGMDWTQVAPAHSPAARRGHALAFDSVRGKTVLFGGEADLRLNDTWEYDGVDWTPTALTNAPLPRLWHSMAYDAALGGVVMFGGAADINTPYGDTWIYDGVSWQQIASSNRPSDRFWAPVVFDSARSQLVVFGGAQNGGPSGVLADTWLLLGINTLPVNWSQAPTASVPTARAWYGMDYDSTRGVTVLFGGSASGPGNFSDTWEWDGFNWVQRFPQSSPPALVGGAMAYDSARHVSVLFGGLDNSNVINATTWEWDGANWTQRSLTAQPPGRDFATMAYDSNRGAIVLFGGAGQAGLLNDTWEFDGNAWTQAAAASSPSPRDYAGMAFDSLRNRTVLFGGRDSSARLADTWQWNGSSWARMSTPTAPYARFWASMAFDAQRGNTVLFGGDHIQPYALGPTNDTWDWDGSQWTRDWTSAAPAVRAGQSMSFDSRRDRIVIFGGINAAMWPASFYADTWELGSGVVTSAGNSAATITPSSLDFGSVDLGTTSSEGHVYVASSGSGPLLTTMSTTADFAISSTDCPSAPDPLAAGASCLVFVTFSPTVAGDRYGQLTFSGNVSGGSQSVPLHGIGIAHDFTISANPSSLSMQVGGPSPTSTISTTVVGAAGTITLSPVTNDPSVSASLSPSTIPAGNASTMTVVIASTAPPGNYGIRVFGTEGAVSHYVDISLQVIAPPDFSIAVSPTSWSMAQGSSASAAVTTTAVGAASRVDLSATVTPAGPTVVLSPSSVAAGAVSTLTVSAGYGVAPGSYTVTVTGVEGSFTHSTTAVVTLTLKGIVNGGFERGDLTGWTQTGAAAAVRSPHTGSYAGQVGSTSASANSTLSQTFTVPASGGKLTYWYWMYCSDKVKNDWFAVTLTDGVTGAVSTLQSPVCTKTGGWTKVTANISSHTGHYVTLTFMNHDDGNPSDPSFTLVDDVSLS